MEAFAAGAADVLVATTVIEVGIDVPNATVMLVEDAERYGISQLHQLRGRVGRGEHDVALPAVRAEGLARGCKRPARRTATASALAEIDLELRGEGELTGTRQSGLARFRFARLPEDADVLVRAHARAEALLAADPRLAAPEHALLREPLERARPRRWRRRDRAPGRDARRRRAGSAGAGCAAPPGRGTRPTSRPRARGAVLDARAARRRARPRPLRRLRRAGDRGALARGRAARCSSSATRARWPSSGANLEALGLARTGGRGARRTGPRGPAQRIAARATHTIWSSSTPLTGALRSWGGSSRAALGPLLAGGGRVVTESDRRAPLALALPLIARTPLRRHAHPHPHAWPLIPASPSARAPTTRSRTATSTSSPARPSCSTRSSSAIVNHPVRKGSTLFSTEERLGFIDEATAHLPNVRVGARSTC